VSSTILLLLWVCTGTLIVSRQPRNLAGWVFIGLGMSWAAESFGFAVTAWSLIRGANVPVRDLFAMLADDSLLPILLLPLLFLLFPDGHPPPGWRWVTWTMFAALGLVLVGYVMGPGPLNNLVDSGILYVNPIGIPALTAVSSVITGIGALLALGSGLATVPAVRGRYRRATGEERQQLRWLVTVATVAGALMVLGILITVVGTAGGNEPPVFSLIIVALALTITVGVPAAYLIAIFRHGLWDLDVVIKKTLVALVLALFLGVTLLAAAVLAGQIALWEETPRLVAIAVGVALGVLLLPLLRLSRRVADRIVYGRRATPYEVLATFSSRVGETYASDDVLPRMAQILQAGSGASSARVLVDVGGELHEAARTGTPDGDEHAQPIVFLGKTVGALAVTFPANDPIDPQRTQLIENLAAQAGPVLRNVGLIEELRASRQRLVAAQDEERRKIERNLHDGVQQQLVALNVQLGLLAKIADRDPAKVPAMASQLQVRATEALEDLRDLARGIYPPLLADRGLAAALEAQARKAAVPTTVTADGIGRYDQAVESAIYFCSLEALNNVAKYAQATRATIDLAQQDGPLRFTVHDDGAGFDMMTTSYGTGLQGMADRLDAIGGSIRVDSAPGTGTIVTGTVPVGSDQTEAASQAASSLSGPNDDLGM
jgi:signal transduction histidine kinase